MCFRQNLVTQQTMNKPPAITRTWSMPVGSVCCDPEQVLRLWVEPRGFFSQSAQLWVKFRQRNADRNALSSLHMGIFP